MEMKKEIARKLKMRNIIEFYVEMSKRKKKKKKEGNVEIGDKETQGKEKQKK